MANPGMRHSYKSLKADPVDTTLIGATKWNERHYFLEDDGSTASGNLGDLPYRGTAGLVTLLTGAQGVLTSAGVGNVPAWTMSPSITNLTLATAGVLAWSTDVNLIRTGADQLGLRRSTNTQTFSVGPAASDLYFEKGNAGAAYILARDNVVLNLGQNNIVRWHINTSGHFLASGAYNIGDGAGNSPDTIYAESAVYTPIIGSAAAVPLNIVQNSLTRWVISTSGHLLANGAFDIGNGAGDSPVLVYVEQAVTYGALTFATLPAAVAGRVCYITDSNTATWGATAAGGGANKVLVWYNGTNWKVFGA